MSFILDALKKSEAERRRGEVPKLQNEPFSLPPQRRSLWPLLLTVALLLNGAVLGWWLLSRDEQTATVARTDSPEPGRFPAVASSETAAPDPVEAAPANEPITVAVHPSPQPVQAYPAEPEVTTVVIGEMPGAAVTPSAGPASGEAVEKGSADRLSESTIAAQTPSKAATAAVAESYPPVSELPGNVRSGLPVLDLQLHFFTPVAERRLVRLNGANLREGDRSGAGLSVVEITSGGVKLSYAGTRFFLPTGRP